MSEPYYRDENVTLYEGDCLDVLADLPDASVDSVVTDPPYGLDFMGKHWDTGAVAFDTAVWGHCLRVLKPGGHLIAFGGTRTWHRLACAVEDAGFEIRDNIAWLYGSGFPKSLDVSKAIDKAAGAERETIGRKGGRYAYITRPELATHAPGGMFRWGDKHFHWDELPENAKDFFSEAAKRKGDITAPATPDAQRWQGWGTALKPAFEPVVVARKPLSGTVAGNVLAHGVGALNIDATRIASTSAGDAGSSRGGSTACTCHEREGDQTSRTPNNSQAASPDAGREGRITLLPSALERAASCPQSQGSQGGCPSSPCSCGEHAQSEEADGQASAQQQHGARGSDDRCATPKRNPTNQSSSCPNCTAPNVELPQGRWPSNVVIDGHAAAEIDRQSGNVGGGFGVRGTGGSTYAGGKGFANTLAVTGQTVEYGDEGGASRFFPTFRYQAKAATDERPTANGIAHPTVKPLDLMRWLVRLVTPPGGTVLEPFAGSGTTAEACIHEHMRCIAIEREADYLPLIVARLSKPMEIGFDFGEAS